MCVKAKLNCLQRVNRSYHGKVNAVFVFMLQQLAEDPPTAAATMVYTLNKDKDKVKLAVDTICKLVHILILVTFI